MKKYIIAVLILFLFSFCEKEYSYKEEINPIPACAEWQDWTGVGIPGFQGNCYLATNAQIRWLQQQGYLYEGVLAPDNGTIPTKAQINVYMGADSVNLITSPEFVAMPYNHCPAIGWYHRPL